MTGLDIINVASSGYRGRGVVKKYLIAGIVAAAFSGAPALAAAPPAPFNWTGCYIGASTGGLWGNAAMDNSFAAPTSVDTNPSGFIGGGQIGCNYQDPSNWLIGLQGEFNWTSAHDSQTIFPPFPYVSETLDVRVSWFASAAARLGYVYGPWLFYGKGGAAWVHDQLRTFAALSSSSFDFSANITRTGWTIGGGFEYAFARDWSATLEYSYYDFGSRSVTVSGISAPPPTPDSRIITLSQNFSVVTVGLHYRFWSGH